MATKVSTEDWIEELKSISVLELSERIKALEEEFGVSATAVAAAAPAAGGGHRARPQGGEGPRRRGPQARQGGNRARGGRGSLEGDPGGRRYRRAEVAETAGYTHICAGDRSKIRARALSGRVSNP